MSLKPAVLTVLLLAGTILAIPVVIGGNGSSSAAGCDQLAVILATIRTIESGGNYSAAPNQGGASGAYQYIDSTWNNYQGYPAAYPAPAEIQDARAASDVQTILATYRDVVYIPIIWYWPRAAHDPSQLDVVPMSGAGNTLTVRQYQQPWLATYQTVRVGSPAGTCADGLPTEDGYALPLDRTLIAANPAMFDAPHHDYPAVDLLVPEGSPVYAVHGVTIARLVDWPHNCYQVGRCEQTCGVGVSINGDDGARYIYCHGTRLNELAVGDTINAGQLIMWTGNTGHSGAPHLHLELRVNGQQRCPQPILQATYERLPAPTAGDLPSTGCTY